MGTEQSNEIQRMKAIKSNRESILKEKEAISNIMKAEGSKLEKVLELNYVTSKDLLKLNKLVCDTIENLASLEMVIDLKLKLFKAKES